MRYLDELVEKINACHEDFLVEMKTVSDMAFINVSDKELHEELDKIYETHVPDCSYKFHTPSFLRQT